MILRSDIRRRMVRINIEIPDDVHARLKMLASAEGKGFYEWLKTSFLSLALMNKRYSKCSETSDRTVKRRQLDAGVRPSTSSPVATSEYSVFLTQKIDERSQLVALLSEFG